MRIRNRAKELIEKIEKWKTLFFPNLAKIYRRKLNNS
jgi:hypothetical protein